MISEDVLAKLGVKHQVTRRDVEQCFENRIGRILEDTRVRHKTNPPTLWFLAKTNKGRILKVVYIQSQQTIMLKTCYETNVDERYLYQKYGNCAY